MAQKGCVVRFYNHALFCVTAFLCACLRIFAIFFALGFSCYQPHIANFSQNYLLTTE